MIKRAFLDLSLRFRREREMDGSPKAIERSEFRLHEVNEAWAVLRSPSARARYDDELRELRELREPSQPSQPSARSAAPATIGSVRFGSAAVPAGEDELPVLEVLDVIDTAAAAGPRERAHPTAGESRTRKWKLFNSALGLAVAFALIGVTGAVGGRTTEASTTVRTWTEVDVGSCVAIGGGAVGGESAEPARVVAVACGGPDAMKVVGRAAVEQHCPIGTKAVIVTGGPENLCTV